MRELAPTPPFFVVHHPGRDNWAVLEVSPGDGVADDDVGRWWLPVLQAHPIARSAVRRSRVGDAAGSEAIADAVREALEARGVVVVGRSVPHPIVYIGRDAVRHLFPWEDLDAPYDAQAHRRFVLDLVRRGMVVPPAGLDRDMARVPAPSATTP